MSKRKPTLFSPEIGYILDVYWKTVDNNKLRLFVVGSMETSKYDMTFSKIRKLCEKYDIKTVKKYMVGKITKQLHVKPYNEMTELEKSLYVL